MKAFRSWVVAIVVFLSFCQLRSQDLTLTVPDTSNEASRQWTFFNLTPDEFLHLPGRGYEYYLPLLPGVVEFNRDLHIRGSRYYENVYALHGFNVTNPVTNTNGFELIPEATEEIEVHTGPAGASQYSANGGIIVSQMRQGGDRLEAFAEYRTDDIVKAGGEALGTVPLGVKNLVATVGGPAIEGVRFFLAGQYRYLRNDQAVFLEPFHYEGLTDDGFWGGSETFGRLLVATDPTQNGIIDIKRNYMANNYTESGSFNGNMLFDLNQMAELPLRLQILGMYGLTKSPGGGGWPQGFVEYYRPLDRQYMNETTNWMIAGRLTHILSSTTFYDIGLSYQSRFAETYDPNFGHSSFKDYLEIPDSAAAAARGFRTSEWNGRYSGPFTQSTIFSFLFTHPEAPNNGYFKDEQAGLGLTLDLTSQINSDWEVKVGGRIDSWTSRLYEFNSIRSLLMRMDPNWDGNFSDAPVFGSEYERRVRYLEIGSIVNWGYDYLGNKTDGYTLDGSSATLDKPFEPVFGSAYGEATYSAGSVRLQFGIRYEYIDPGLKTVATTTSTGKPDFGGVPFDSSLWVMDESEIVKTDPFYLVLPRVNLSVNAGNGIQLFAGYGQYAQMPPFDLLMQSNYQFSEAISTLPDGYPYAWLGSHNLAFTVKPERSTQFEVGATVPVATGFSISGTAYYKNMKDQLQMGKYYDDAGNWILSVRSSDGSGVAKGFELSAILQRTAGFALWANYALSVASGLSSNPTSNIRQVSDYLAYPTVSDTLLVPTPYDYQQIHRASLLADFRTSSEEGPFLGDIEITLVATFNSGHPYTREASIEYLGAYSPWYPGVRSLIDPRSQNKLEPNNSSETPNIFNLDMRISKGFAIGPVNAEVYFSMLNVFNTKQIINVYPYSGTTTGDAWYRANPYYYSYAAATPLFEPFYQDINVRNRWAYMGATGNDLYGSPRQFRIGLSVQY
jgi:hypothetical protein